MRLTSFLAIGEVEGITAQDMAERVPWMEPLWGPEASLFAATGELAEDVMSIVAVHPLREDALRRLVERSNGDWAVVEALLAGGRLRRVRYDGEIFYMKNK